MIKSISLYVKHQKSYLFFLITVFAMPLALFLQFSTYKLPKIQYVFLGALFVSQYVFYREKDFRKRIETQVESILKKEFKRIPSRKEIFERSSLVVYYRGISIVFSTIAILSIMMYFREF